MFWKVPGLFVLHLHRSKFSIDQLTFNNFHNYCDEDSFFKRMTSLYSLFRTTHCCKENKYQISFTNVHSFLAPFPTLSVHLSVSLCGRSALRTHIRIL
jgi:hypothetical protein